MSKMIKITPQCIEECRRDFEEALKKAKLADGKISFTKTFGGGNRKAKLYFYECAWFKMQMLVKEFSKEVAWHGVAKRGDDPEKDEYYISDILVYPQEVTGATVNTDQEKYQLWLMNHDDEVFNNIRMQGHSHVNMGVTPSGVDLSHQEKILDQLDDDMFYIFMIWNKSGDKNIKIYDLAKNTLFETFDITIEILDDETGITRFLKTAKEMVKDKPAVTTTYGGYQGGAYRGVAYSGGSYNSGSYYSTQNPTTPQPASATPAKVVTAVANTPKTGPTYNGVKQESKKNRRKGKRKMNPDRGRNACNTKQVTLFDAYDDDPYVAR